MSQPTPKICVSFKVLLQSFKCARYLKNAFTVLFYFKKFYFKQTCTGVLPPQCQEYCEHFIQIYIWWNVLVITMPKYVPVTFLYFFQYQPGVSQHRFESGRRQTVTACTFEQGGLNLSATSPMTTSDVEMHVKLDFFFFYQGSSVRRVSQEPRVTPDLSGLPDRRAFRELLAPPEA